MILLTVSRVKVIRAGNGRRKIFPEGNLRDVPRLFRSGIREKVRVCPAQLP